MNGRREQQINKFRRKSVQAHSLHKFNIDSFYSKGNNQANLNRIIISNKKKSFNKLKFMPFQKRNTNDWKKNHSKRISVQLSTTKNNKIFEKYNMNEEINSKTEFQKTKISYIKKNNNKSIKNINNLKNTNFDSSNLTRITSVIKLEHDIKNVLNYMKLKIAERKLRNSRHSDNNILNLERNKLSGTPELKPKKKSKFKNKSFISKKERRISLIETDTVKRSKSFRFSEESIKKTLIRIIFKISKENHKIESLKYKRSNIIEHYSLDEENNLDHYLGFSFSPESNFIFLFDIMIIISNLFSFIFIPLRIAKNQDVRGPNTLIDTVIKFFVDFIYIADFIISFFRGYYNSEMKIIRNNKKILIHYLKQELFMDLIEAIPLNILVEMNILQISNIYYGYFNFKAFFIKLFMFVKSFKIFKILKSKNNKALENLYEHLSKNYYVETLSNFIFDLIIFFLFLHLFICLHIYFSLQGNPNWISNINVLNGSFITKYIASFYFLMTTMTTVGYGDIVCISSVERIFHIILLAIGTTIYTFIVSKVGNYLRDQSHEQTKLIEDLNILESIRVGYPSMPFKLYTKIKNHLLNISKKRKKKGISLLINDIPETLKNHLLFKIYAKEIREFSIFKGVKNSSFILQMLTNFISIVTKKEDIIILEGELIDNIIFVKDGRLVMEIIIDLNDPYKSIQKYLEINFNGISKKGELEGYKNINRINSLLNDNKNFNDLKAEIDNIILGKHESKHFNSSLHHNKDQSIYFGKMDDSISNSKVNNANEEYEIMKILDVRKNDHFGEVHMFLQKPSPFTLKTKSRIAELLILRKNDAIIISKNYPNIWREIYNKSYHNLVAIKKLTFMTLKRYYNTNLANRTGYGFKFDNSSTKSYISILDRASIITNANKNKNANLINDSNSKKFSSNNLIKKIDSDTSKTNNSSLSLSQSLIKRKKNNAKSIINIPKEIEEIPHSEYKQNENINLIKRKTFEKFSFNNGSDKINSLIDKKTVHTNKNISINKSKDIFNKLNNNEDDKFNTSIEQFNEILKSINGSKRESVNYENLIDQTVKFINKSKNFDNSNSREKIFTLEDIDENFSKRIRKKLKLRKKIEKLKDFLEIKRKENNRNLIEVYSNIISKRLNIFMDKNSIDISKSLKSNIPKELIDMPLTSENDMELSQILDSASDEEKCQRKFDVNSLKSIVSESFQIKSSYKNINILSEGEIIKNVKYKKFLEHLIKKDLKKNINYDKLKTMISNFSNKLDNYKSTQFINTGILKKIHKTVVDGDKYNKKQEHHIRNSFRNNLNNIINKKNKSSTKLELGNFGIIKNMNENQSEKNEDTKTNENTYTNFFKANKERKNLIKIKNLEMPFKSRNNNSNIIDNKSCTSSVNIFKELEKDDNSKYENKIELINKNDKPNKFNHSDNNSINSKEEKQCIIC